MFLLRRPPAPGEARILRYRQGPLDMRSASPGHLWPESYVAIKISLGNDSLKPGRQPSARTSRTRIAVAHDHPIPVPACAFKKDRHTSLLTTSARSGFIGPAIFPLRIIQGASRGKSCRHNQKQCGWQRRYMAFVNCCRKMVWLYRATNTYGLVLVRCSEYVGHDAVRLLGQRFAISSDTPH